MEKIFILGIIVIALLASINTCTENREREVAALEQIAEKSSHKPSVESEVSDNLGCAEFLSKPEASQFIVYALMARSFIEPMSADRVNNYPEDSLREKIAEYQREMLRYDEIDAQGRMDCFTIESLGLLQMR
jgi:hypothetical protein